MKWTAAWRPQYRHKIEQERQRLFSRKKSCGGVVPSALPRSQYQCKRMKQANANRITLQRRAPAPHAQAATTQTRMRAHFMHSAAARWAACSPRCDCQPAPAHTPTARHTLASSQGGQLMPRPPAASPPAAPRGCRRRSRGGWCCRRSAAAPPWSRLRAGAGQGRPASHILYGMMPSVKLPCYPRGPASKEL
jgi:hypothetical protein